VAHEEWLGGGRAAMTLSKLRMVKSLILTAAIAARCELSTAALAHVYFEKMVLQGVVVKENRKAYGAVALLLAFKFNDESGGGAHTFKTTTTTTTNNDKNNNNKKKTNKNNNAAAAAAAAGNKHAAAQSLSPTSSSSSSSSSSSRGGSHCARVFAAIAEHLGAKAAEVKALEWRALTLLRLDLVVEPDALKVGNSLSVIML
jgi:hypothetical protein